MSFERKSPQIKEKMKKTVTFATSTPKKATFKPKVLQAKQWNREPQPPKREKDTKKTDGNPKKKLNENRGKENHAGENAVKPRRRLSFP